MKGSDVRNSEKYSDTGPSLLSQQNTRQTCRSVYKGNIAINSQVSE